MKKQITVVGAVIVRDGEILCAQRGQDRELAGLWEFPGGKIEPGETPEAALKREIDEELRCEVRVGERIETTVHHYDFGIVTLTTFYCELVVGTPSPTQHAAVRWLRHSRLHELNWAEADLPSMRSVRQAAFAEPR